MALTKGEHTAKPWCAVYERQWGWCVRSKGLKVTRISGNKEPAYVAFKLPSKEDARLIAAAPELLEALKAIVERSAGKLYDTDQETGETFVALASAAIAAAEGKEGG